MAPGLLLAVPLRSSQPLNLHVSSAQFSPLCVYPYMARGHLFTKFSIINKVEIHKWEREELKRDQLTITEIRIKFKDYDY